MKIIEYAKEHYNFILIIIASFVLGAIVGMSFTNIETLRIILINTISGTVTNAPWFILIFISVKTISIAIKVSGEKIIKNIPIWIEDFYKKRMYLLKVERAIVRNL